MSATTQQIKRLVIAGGKEWIKGEQHRVYFNQFFSEYPNSDFYFDCSNGKVYFKNGKTCRTADAKKVQDKILGFANTEVKKSSLMTRKEILSKVMTMAWSRAKSAAAKFGGQAKEYLAETMKKVWAEAKASLAKSI